MRSILLAIVLNTQVVLSTDVPVCRVSDGLEPGPNAWPKTEAARSRAPVFRLRGGVGAEDLRERAAKLRQAHASAEAKGRTGVGIHAGRERNWDAESWIESTLAEGSDGTGEDDDAVDVQEIEGGRVQLKVFGGTVELPLSQIDTPLEGTETSILFVAAAYGKEEVLRKLLRLGANPHITNEDGDSALHLAAFQGQASVLKPLVQAGVAVNSRNNFGATPLHAAANSGSESAVKVLLGLKANLRATDSEGLRAHHHADAAGHTHLVDLLRELASKPGP